MLTPPASYPGTPTGALLEGLPVGGSAPHTPAARMAASARPRGAAQPHAVVIGSGFGGLAAAVRLGARGYRVTVVEQLAEPGGRALVHRQDGFTFDAGPTVIT
eukprot:gene7271-9689_t